MADIAKIKVTYQSNYNGCSVVLLDATDEEIDVDNEAQEHQATVEKCADTIINKAYEECDPHGRFYGDTDELEEFAKKTIHDAFGEHVVVEFEEDNMST